MRRHPALHDLSRDHHDHLVRAQAIERAPTAADAALQAGRARALWSSGRLAAHLDAEALLLGAVPAGPQAEALRADQAALRAAFTAGPQAAAEGPRLALVLRGHARWCEDTFFPWLQAALPEPALQAVAVRLEATRRASGLPVGPDAACALDEAPPGPSPTRS